MPIDKNIQDRRAGYLQARDAARALVLAWCDLERARHIYRARELELRDALAPAEWDCALPLAMASGHLVDSPADPIDQACGRFAVRACAMETDDLPEPEDA
jgi:hypothetical protein